MTVKKKKNPQRKAGGTKKVQATSHQLSAPEVFFGRLRARLVALGLDPDALDTKTSLLDPPPCFALRQSSYAEWLAAALNAEPPLRFGMPAEPNYCHDCTSHFRKAARKAGACLFPNMKLAAVVEFGERTHAGQTQSRHVTESEFEPVVETAAPAPSI
jgi:hypothetical protein